MLQKIFIFVTIIIFLELFLMIKISQTINWIWIFLEIISSFLLGLFFLKKIGIQAQSFLQKNPAKILQTMLLKASLVFSALFLILPGLLTDLLGIILLIPPLKTYLLSILTLKSSPPPYTKSDNITEIKTSYTVLDE